MFSTEVPTYLHSEAERAAMLIKIKDIASKAEISAEELQEVGWLILNRDQEVGEDLGGVFDGEWRLPNDESPKIEIAGAIKDEYFIIGLLDKIEPGSEDAGEQIIMEVDEKGRLRWHVGLLNSMYSEFYGRRVPIESDNYLVAKDPLSPRDHAVLARRLVEVYNEMIAESLNLSDGSPNSG